jgi:glycogen operon protein
VPRAEDWHDPAFRCLGVELRVAAEEDRSDTDALFIVFNAGPARDVVLPRTAQAWRMILDTTRPTCTPEAAKAAVAVPANSVLVFEAVTAGAAP